jgi:hypothetical protein
MATAPDSGLAALTEEGFETELCQQHLLVHSVPYVTTSRTIERATLVCKYVENAGTILPPTAAGDDHQVWWTGSFPCRSDGTPMTAELFHDVNRRNGRHGQLRVRPSREDACLGEPRRSDRTEAVTGRPSA